MKIETVDHMDQVLRRALVLENPQDFLKRPVPPAEVVPPPFEAPAPAGDIVTH